MREADGNAVAAHTSLAVRWAPTASMWLVSLVSYVDRNTLALLAPVILKETGLSAEQYGFIIAAFSLAYTVGNPVWGWILDRIGLRRGMAAAVSLWTVASASHAFAGGFAGFVAARALLGFGEGATFPGGLRTVTQTLPPRARGRGVALAYSGGSSGAVLTPLIVTPIFLAFGWRGAFVFTGVIGLGWLLLWAFISRREDVRAVTPRDHAATSAFTPKLRDPRLWAFIFAYAFGGLPIAFVLYGTALYLGRARGLDQAAIGKLLWIPPLGWEVGYFLWGWLSDRGARPGMLMGLALLIGLPLAFLPWVPGMVPFMAGLFCAMFATAAFIVLSVAYAVRVYTPAHAGLIAGIGAGSWSAVVALFMPVLGRLFDQHRYSEAFLIAGIFPLIGYAGWKLLDRRAVAGQRG